MEATNRAPLTVKGVCIDRHGRVLLCRNHRREWELPGGRPLVTESFETCLTREIAEERGITAAVEDLVDAFPYEVLPERWVNVIVYACHVLDDGMAPTVSPEHDRVAFLEPDTLRTETVATEYRRSIDRVLSGRPGAG